MKRTVAAVMLAAGLAACQTNLRIYPDVDRTALSEALPNPTYALPMVQFDLTVTYTLAACPSWSDPKTGVPAKPLDIEVEVKSTKRYAALERYAIDYRALGNGLKTTDFAMESWPGGGLKSINAAVDDQTGEFVGGAVKLGVSIASLAAGNPAGAAANVMGGGVAPSGGGTAESIDAFLKPAITAACRPEAVQALADKAAALARIKIIGGESRTTEREIADILARAQVRLATRADRQRLADLQGVMRAASQDLATQQAAVTKADKVLVHTAVYVWPDQPLVEAGAVPTSRAVSAWLSTILRAEDTVQVDEEAVSAGGLLSRRMSVQIEAVREAAATLMICEPVSRAGPSDDDGVADCIAPSLSLHAALVRQMPTPPPPRVPVQPIDTQADGGLAGLVFRDAMTGRLILCRGAPNCGDTSPPGVWVRPLFTGDVVSTPQLGQLRYLPFENGTFENNSLSLALAENGSLLRLQYVTKAAVAAELAASAADAVGQINTYREERDQARAEADAAAQALVIAERADTLADLKFQTDLLTQQRALAEAQTPAGPIVPAALTTETTILEAQILNLQARQRLAEALNALNPPPT